MSKLNIDAIRDMVGLSLESTRALAEHCGLSQPNLITGLAGKRSIPADKLAALLDALGIEGEKLRPSQVHLWKVGIDLSPLQRTLQAFMPNGGTIAGIWREGGKGIDFSRSFDKQMFVIFDDRNLIVLRRSGLGTHSLVAPKVGPQTLPGFSWLGGRTGVDTMVHIPRESFLALQQGQPMPVNDLRKLLGTAPEIDWGDVFTYLQRHWRTPTEAMEAIQSITGNP
jgi:transcriptional regulator with XRE-family HTH domain